MLAVFVISFTSSLVKMFFSDNEDLEMNRDCFLGFILQEIEGESHPYLGSFISKCCFWFRVAETVTMGPFHGILVACKSESAALGLMFTVERDTAGKGMFLFLLV